MGWNEQFIRWEGNKIYARRNETVDRSFADSKQNHDYRYAMVRGLKRNEHNNWLICVAQNMKNVALKTTKYEESTKNEDDVANLPSFTS